MEQQGRVGLHQKWRLVSKVGQLKPVLDGRMLSRPDAQGKFCVQPATGEIWRLGAQPELLARLEHEKASRFLCSSLGYLIVYPKAVDQTLDALEVEAVNYRVYEARTGRLRAEFSGDNRCEPSVSPGGQLLVLPGARVTLYWPQSNRSLQLAAGSQAVFSRGGERLALCGQGVTILDTFSGSVLAQWSGQMFRQNRSFWLAQVLLTWNRFLCEFNQLFDQSQGHCFRELDLGLRIRGPSGIVAATITSREPVHFAVAADPGSAFRVLADRIELVRADGRMVQHWEIRPAQGLAPVVLPLPQQRYLLMTNPEGLVVVDESGRKELVCEQTAGAQLKACAVKDSHLAGLDQNGRLTLWSAENGVTLAGASSRPDGQELVLCGSFVYANGLLFQRPGPSG